MSRSTSRCELRPTIAGDLEALIGKPPAWRIRAYTMDVGGSVVGVGGLSFPPHGDVIAFAHLSKEARRYPRELHRAGILSMEYARSMKFGTVWAEAEQGNPAAVPWLKWFGFVETKVADRTIWVWRNDEAHTH